MGQTIRGNAVDYGGDADGGAAKRGLASSAAATASAHDGAAGRALSAVPARAGNERRHSFRVEVAASASLWVRGQFAGYYQVRDLSLGGCLLEGKPPSRADASVEVVLHVAERAPLVLSAALHRSAAGSLALRFERMPPVVEEVLQDIVVETFARVRTRENDIALVVEPRHALRHTLVRSLRELGRRAVGVATALDAVQLLVEEGERVHTVFIEAESEVVPSLELIEFLMHNHPGVKRVLIGEPADLAPHWLEEAAGEVHALLESTSDREALSRLLRKLDRTPAEHTPT